MLSDKAKGKQRATEHPLNGTDLQPPGIILDSVQAPTRDLVVRFTEGFPDLIVPVHQKDAVRDVKKKVNIRRSAYNIFISHDTFRFVKHDSK